MKRRAFYAVDAPIWESIPIPLDQNTPGLEIVDRIVTGDAVAVWVTVRTQGSWVGCVLR